MAFLGADTDELREVGQEFEDGKEVVDQVITYLKALIALLRAASFFSGGASAAYAQYLESVVLPWLQKISMALGLFAKVLGSQADAQDQASEGGTVDYGSLPSYQTPALPAPIQPYDGEPIIGGAQGGTAGPGTTTTTTTTGPDGTTTTTTTTVPGATVTAPLTGIDGTATAPPTGTTGAIGATSPTTADPFPGGNLDTRAPAAETALGGGGLSGGGSGGGTGGGLSGGGSGGGGSELGTSTIGSGDGSGGSVGGHTTPLADGGIGGSTPGADQLGATGLGSGTDAATPASGQGASYGAAAGIAGGAAALGLGGAALAGRTGGGDPKIDSLASSNGRGSSGAQVTELQERLTAAGYDTRGADGKWGPNTQAAFDAYRNDHPLPVQAGSGYTSPTGYDYQQITGVKGNPNVTPEFLRGVEGMAQRLGAQPEHLMAAMSFETGGSFASDVRNPRSSATGLIQFMDSTAKGMGTTTSALAQMSPVEQLTYVEKYFEPHRGHLGDLESVYTSILAGHPASGNEALFTQGDQAYGPNRELDVNRNGVITAAEATAHVRSRMGH